MIPQCLVQQQLCSTATYDDSVKSSLESMQILTLFRPCLDLSLQSLLLIKYHRDDFFGLENPSILGG